MKKLVLVLLACMVCFGAGLNAQSQKKMVGKSLNTPFSDKKYKSNKEYFRAVGNAESVKEATALDKARAAARAQIAEEAETAVRRVTERYVQENEMGNDMDYVASFEGLTRTATQNVLRGVVEMDSEVFVKTIKDGGDKKYVYNAYVALELNRDELKKQIENTAMKDERLRVKFDKSKFEETFNKELEASKELEW